MAKTAKKTDKVNYPHFEEKRLVKVWVKREGKSFQMSVEGIGGRFYGSLTRKMDGDTVADAIGVGEKVSRKGTANLKDQLKGMDKKAKLALVLSLLS